MRGEGEGVLRDDDILSYIAEVQSRIRMLQPWARDDLP